MAKAVPTPCIYVLAGTNGAGKSSIGGAMFSQLDAEYFNPDEAAKGILAVSPVMTQQEANGAAWNQGRRLLERAIDERCNFAFETTLGGHTIPALLEKAVHAKIEVRIWYVGLNSPELHISRVRSRVEKGGHDISEAKIRERFIHSRANLIRLISKLTEILVYDNSKEADPEAGQTPDLKPILHTVNGKVIDMCELTLAPDWTKPILMAAIKSSAKTG